MADDIQEHVLNLTLSRWLDVTPVGRIITRCTQDINSIDGSFTNFLCPLMFISLNLVTYFVSSVVMAGWAALIPGFLLIALGSYLGNIYLKAQLSIKREMSTAKAPVISQVGVVLSGLSQCQDFICY